MVLLLNDCEKGEGVDLAKRYEVRAYPTYAMVDHAGEVTGRWVGYPGVAGFIETVEAALADRSTIAEKKRRYEAEPTLPLALALAGDAEAQFRNSEAVAYYRTVMALDPARALETREKIFLSMFYGLRAEDFTVDDVLTEGQALLADEGHTLDQLMTVVYVVKQAAPADRYLPFLERALAATAAAVPADDEEAAALAGHRQHLAIDEALLIRGDKDLALRLRREALPENWRENPGQTQRFVLWCLEHELNLDEAYELAAAAVDLAADDAGRASLQNTAASAAFMRGDVAQATAHQREAVALAPARERYQRTLATYEEALAGPPGVLVEPKTGAEFPDRVTVEHDGRPVTLLATGVGLRQRTIMKVDVYTIVSYVSGEAQLPAAGAERAAAIRSLDSPKRIEMNLLRGFSRDRLVGSFTDVIAKNYTDNSAFAVELAVFLAYFDRDAEKGDRLVLDYRPGVGLTTTVNDEVKGTIAGAALSEALWTVWFGDKPADGGLRRDLAGGS